MLVLNSIHKHIITNLHDHPYKVSELTAIRHCDISEGVKSLQELIENNIVIKHHCHSREFNFDCFLYQLNPNNINEQF